jgi:hypothetical protein
MAPRDARRSANPARWIPAARLAAPALLLAGSLGACSLVAGLSDHELAPDVGAGGQAGSGGQAGTGGQAGIGGQAGTGGQAGSGGQAGTGGQAGSGGQAGAGGQAGSGGAAGGDAGAPDADAGPTSCSMDAQCGSGSVCCTSGACGVRKGFCVPDCTSAACSFGSTCCSAPPGPPDCAQRCVPDCTALAGSCNPDQVCDTALKMCFGDCRSGAPCPPNRPTCEQSTGLCH